MDGRRTSRRLRLVRRAEARTILYTKQAVGEMGGAVRSKTPWSWVEPDPVPFARLQAMADLERQRLSLWLLEQAARQAPRGRQRSRRVPGTDREPMSSPDGPFNKADNSRLL